MSTIKHSLLIEPESSNHVLFGPRYIPQINFGIPLKRIAKRVRRMQRCLFSSNNKRKILWCNRNSFPNYSTTQKLIFSFIHSSSYANIFFYKKYPPFDYRQLTIAAITIFLSIYVRPVNTPTVPPKLQSG